MGFFVLTRAFVGVMICTTMTIQKRCICNAFISAPTPRQTTSTITALSNQRNSLQLQSSINSRRTRRLFAKKNNNGKYPYDMDDDDDLDDLYYDEDDQYYDNQKNSNRRRNQRRSSRDDLGMTDGVDGEMNLPSPFGRRQGWRLPEAVSKALLLSIFVLGVSVGVTVDSAINVQPKDLASREAIDVAAPSSNYCLKYGASAMAFDQRVFVSFNPFNVFVAQADVKPACVLRPSNVVPVLRDKKLINEKEVQSCKANMNTWAYVGDLDNQPQLSCVYKSQDAQNEFLDKNPKFGIGEDVYDNDRAAAVANKFKDGVTSTGKLVKDSLTEAQKMEAVKKEAMNLGL